jgi:hypothetical protein
MKGNGNIRFAICIISILAAYIYVRSDYDDAVYFECASKYPQLCEVK